MVVLEVRNVEGRASRIHSFGDRAQNPRGQRNQSSEQVENPVEVKKHEIIKMKVQRENPTIHEKSPSRDQADGNSQNSRFWRISTVTR